MTTLYTFHVTVHARPAGVAAGNMVDLDGRQVSTLKVQGAAVGAPFDISFEAAAEALAQLPRMFIEPDGSFVWVSAAQDAPWQVDGVLYDRNERLLFAELKGSCPPGAFDDLLRALGWPATAVMFQLTREALYLDEATFRQWAARSA